MIQDGLEEALHTLGSVLAVRHTPYSLAVVGGGALLLLGVIDRPTRDLDVVAAHQDGRYVPLKGLPPALAEAAADVGDALGLAADWLNTGPASLLELGLPEGFRDRVDLRRFGALELHVASRWDQVCFKLYATVDLGPRSKHVADLRALRPTPAELLGAARWAVTHDPSVGFRRELDGALAHLGVVEIPRDL